MAHGQVEEYLLWAHRPGGKGMGCRKPTTLNSQRWPGEPPSHSASGSQCLKVSCHLYTEMILQWGVNQRVCNHFLPLAFLHLSLFLSGINSSEATQYLNHPSPYSPAKTMTVDCLLISEFPEVLLEMRGTWFLTSQGFPLSTLLSAF